MSSQRIRGLPPSALSESSGTSWPFLNTEILNLVSQVPDTFQYLAKAEPPNSAVVAYVTMFNLIFLQQCNKLSVI